LAAGGNNFNDFADFASALLTVMGELRSPSQFLSTRL